MRKWALLLILFAIPLVAQPQDVKQAEIDSLKAELEETQARLDSLVRTNNPIDLGNRITEAYKKGTENATTILIVISVALGIVASLGGILGIMGVGQTRKAGEILNQAREAQRNVQSSKKEAEHYLERMKEIVSKTDELFKNFVYFNNLNQGLSLVYSRNFKDALDIFEKALKEDPESEMAWFYKARCLEELNFPERAIEAYKECIRIKPGNAFSHYNIGTILANRGDFKEAIEYFKKAAELDPLYTATYENIAGSYLNLITKSNNEAERNAFSEEAYSNALKVVELSNGQEGYYNLACALVHLGSLDEALNALQLDKWNRLRGFMTPWKDASFEPLRKPPYRKKFIKIVGPPPEGVEEKPKAKRKAKRKPKPKSTKPKKK